MENQQCGDSIPTSDLHEEKLIERAARNDARNNFYSIVDHCRCMEYASECIGKESRDKRLSRSSTRAYSRATLSSRQLGKNKTAAASSQPEMKGVFIARIWGSDFC